MNNRKNISLPMQIKVVNRTILQCSVVFVVYSIISSVCAMGQNRKPLVRLAVINVDSAQVSSYNKFLEEEIEASIRIEPGVITLCAIAEKENPTQVTLFETYADSSHYRSHLATAHFQKYKTGTMAMVKDLQLIRANPIIYTRKAQVDKLRAEHLFIRLVKIKLDPSQIEAFNRLARTVMEPGITNEPGLLLMYAVSEENEPTNISILEVYANSAAYEAHLKTSHFLKYKSEAKEMIQSMDIIAANPILLGSKPQKKATE